LLPSIPDSSGVKRGQECEGDHPLLANASPPREQPGDEDDSSKEADDDARELSRDTAAAPPRQSPLLALPRLGAAQRWRPGSSGRPCARQQTGKRKWRTREKRKRQRRRTKTTIAILRFFLNLDLDTLDD
jgi:hypothetical protein